MSFAEAAPGPVLLRELVDAGYDVSAGVLNALDSDEDTGRELGLMMAVEAPFSPVSDEAHAENLLLIDGADVVVVTAVPLSHGNERNIAAALQAAAAGKPVWADAAILREDLCGAASALEPAGARLFRSTSAARRAGRVAAAFRLTPTRSRLAPR